MVSSVCVNLTRLVEAAKGAGGAGWFGLEVCTSLCGNMSVTVLASDQNYDYILEALGEYDLSTLDIEQCGSDIGRWLDENGARFDVYIDPLNGLEPEVFPHRIATISVIHDLMFHRESHVFTQHEIDYRANHYSSAINRADVVLTVSEREKRDIEAMFPGKVVRSISQPPYFAGGDSGRVRREGEPITLFSPGVQWNHKNQFRLASAFAALLDAGRIPQDSRLCFSAISPVEANHRLLAPLIDLSNRNEQILFLPYLSREQFAAFVGSCDGYVLPSIHEGYGIPLIEAVAAGKPALTARFPSIEALKEVPDFVRFIENPRDIRSIADSLERFINDLPSGTPRPELCPTRDAFAQDLADVVRLAAATAKRSVKHVVKHNAIVKRRQNKVQIFAIGAIDPKVLSRFAGTEVEFLLFDAAPEGAGAIRIGALPGAGDKLLCNLAHEILLADARFVLLCHAHHLEKMELSALRRSLARLRQAEDAAVVHLVDLFGAPINVLQSQGLPQVGLYDLETLDLPFETSLFELKEKMAAAKALHDPAPRRALVADPFLRTAAGHHLSVATALSQSLTAQGYFTVVSCHQASAVKSVPGAMMVRQAFTDYLYGQNTDIGLACYEFSREVGALALGAGDLIFAFCATPTMVAGIAMMLGSIKEAERPHIVIRFDRPQWCTPRATVGYAECFKLLRQLGVRRNFSFSVESVGLQRLFETYSGETFPIHFNNVNAPVSALAELNVPVDADQAQITIAFVGEAREEKGFQFLPDVIERVLGHVDADRDVRFRIQAGSNSWNETPPIIDARARLEQLSKVYPGKIELIPGTLPEEEYLDLIRKSDILFMPYFPPPYRIRGSGVANEAAAYKTPMVVSHGLDIVDTYAGHDVTESREYSADALAEALSARTSALLKEQLAGRSSRAVPSLPPIAQFAAKFLQSEQNLAASMATKIALWIGNDTSGEGSQTVYDSQIAYLEARGYFVYRLIIPYPAAWRLDHPWEFDLSKFVKDGVVVANFKRSPAIEQIMESLARGADVGQSFMAAWSHLDFSKQVIDLIRSAPPSLAVVNYAHHMPVLENILDRTVPTIVETHDIQALQYAIQRKRQPNPADIKREMALVGQFDRIVSISQSESRLFAEYCSAEKVRWCMPFIDAPAISMAEQWDFDMLFVGSDHDANMISLNWFLDKVYDPFLKPQGLTLKIVGNAARHIDPGRFGPLVTCEGRVPDLDRYYGRCGVAILPIHSGAGVPIKVIDAFTRGVPFVVTDFASDAMSFDGQIPVARTELDFAEQVVQCLADPAERMRRHRVGREFAGKWASKERYFEVWDDIVGDLLQGA